MSDSFQKEFTTLRELGEEIFVLRGSTLIVEILPPEEIKTQGGLIMATVKDQMRGDSMNASKLEVGRVLMVGQGYWNEETKEREAVEAQPGAIVILPQYSFSTISTFPGLQKPTGNKLAMVKMGDILAYYPSEEAYQTAKAKLN